VVIADLRINNKSFGPHGFLIDFRVNGDLVSGISLEDMGRKTIGNDLDNAAINFDHVVVAKSCLLSRFAQVNDKGEYVAQEKMRIEVIGQRLLTGRVIVAQWALTFAQKLYADTKTYAKNKKCWAPGGESTTLLSLPHLASLFADTERVHARLQNFISKVQAALSRDLVSRRIPGPELVEAIAVAKVYLVENALQQCFRLKQEVGSYALMEGTGFEHVDFITCCKFAEGDSRILQTKLARDAVRGSGGKARVRRSGKEKSLLESLVGSGKAAPADVVFQLADEICERTVEDWVGAKM
jgi:acyl-CoA oxidase